MKNLLSYFRVLRAAALAAPLTLLLAGCGSGGINPNLIPPPPPVTTFSGPTFTGAVKAGSQNLTGAVIQLYATGTTGNGSAATALLTSTIATDASGAFTVPAAYPCPAATSQVYAVSRGGHIGSASNNSALTLIVALGACNQIPAASHFVINEVTTVATTWALSQFLSAGANIGASATNTIGLANAVATAANLANPTTGSAPGATFPSTGSAPTAKLNSLANLLNTCTTSTSASTTACSTLLGSNANTLDAVLRIVRNPGAGVATLYTQSLASTAFTPVLTEAPSDWTLFLSFTGGGMDSPSGLGVDTNGNVWVGSYFSAVNPDPNVGSATEFSPTGKPLFPDGITGAGLENVYALAIDGSNNIWISNEASAYSVNSGLGSVTVLNSSGKSISNSTGFSAGGIDYPISVAIDTDSTAWVLDFGNSHLTHLSSSGASLAGSGGYTSSDFVFPVAIAVDASHNIWVANQSDVTVTKVSSDGKTFSNVSCCSGASGLALDQSGNVWVANYFGNSISEISSAGVVNPSGPFTSGGSIYHPQGIAIDGAGNVWVANFRANYLTELAGASSTAPLPGQSISPAAGWAPDANLFGAFAIVIDASGNIWITNFNNNSVTEFVGLAAPVKTPLIGLPQAP